MWSKTILAFLLSVNIRRAPDTPMEDEEKQKTPRGFRLWFALPAPLLLMLVDMAEDCAIVLTPFVRSKEAGRKAKLAWAGLSVLKALALELCFETGPTDFLDVDVDDGAEHVRVSMRTR